MTPLRSKLGKWKILRGEKILQRPCWEAILCGQRDALLSVDNNLLGIPLLLEVLMDFAGVRRLRRGRSFRGFWLRITQLYPGKEITLWIKPDDAFVFCEDKLPESTRDKLTAWGDEFQLSWGNWIGFSWGSFLNYIGEVTPLNVWYTAGEQSLDQDCRGSFVKNVCTLLGNVEICWRIPNFLKFDNSFAWGECTDLLAHSLGS